jgi:dienelactone hydrolase
MGRTLTGYEVQTVLAGIDALKAVSGRPPVGVFGHGDGGRVALYAAALDERIAVAGVSGTFGPREGLFAEPIDRNVWGLLREFGDAEVGAFLVAPRKLVLDPDASTRTAADFWPRWPGPTPQPGRAQAAPGTLGPVPDADVTREVLRLDHYVGRVVDRAPMLKGREIGTADFLYTLLGKELPPRKAKGMARDFPTTHDPAGRQRRLFDQYVAHVQKLWQDSDAARKEFWKRADPSSPATWEQSTDQYRTHFHERVIGKLPEPTGPLNPRTRKLYDEPKWTGHEVLLDVNPDVIAYGVLLLPKDIRPGERRPVVVCQHGLEGRPTDVTNPKERTRYYNSFGAQLADRGYIVYAPQNPYIFGTHFRQLQRKANPLGLSLFSFVVRQHQRTLDWLETLPQVDAKRIGFYGLSYGGKTAMRVPAIERRYALSICSGDFNEWVGKNVSVNLDRGYMWTSEYEMYEFDLGHTFNYAEMAYLIAPRPFMAERGHDDGVGTDEMVAWEYAKVRYLYANKLRLPDRTAIEFFPGGHEIHGEGTFAFLDRHLNWTPR